MRANADRQPAWGLLPLRLILGIVFLAHGWLKFSALGVAGTTKFMGGLGVPLPQFAAVFITGLELIGGAALILGLGTRYIAALLACDMLGAILLAKRDAGFFSPNGWELEVTVCVACLTLTILGAGGMSIDSAVRSRRFS